MSAHTPGPWIAPDADKGNNLVVNAADWKDHWIKGRMQIAVTPCNTRETMANVYLISAAPEMLAALRDVLEEDDGLHCAKQIKAVIAKAEGRVI